MNINNTQYQTSFGAKFKIQKTKAFVSPSKFFDTWLTEKEVDWADKAHLIGTNKDIITITLGKNDIKVGTSNIFKKQNMNAEAKLDGFKIKSNDMSYDYTRTGDYVDRYFYGLDERVESYLDFIKRLAKCKISSKK